MVKLHRHGLVARHQTGLREHGRDDGKPPLLCSITKRGLETAQRREPAPAISARREWREIDQSRAARFAHDLHAAGWAIAFHHAVGALATDRWRTPRYATGRYPVPQVGSGQRRHPVTLNEIPISDGQAIIDLELKSFSEVKPDLSLELRIDTIKHLRPPRRARPQGAPPTTARSSSPTTRSSAAGRSPTTATASSAPARLPASPRAAMSLGCLVPVHEQ
jgi:hypothetical protein